MRWPSRRTGARWRPANDHRHNGINCSDDPTPPDVLRRSSVSIDSSPAQLFIYFFLQTDGTLRRRRRLVCPARPQDRVVSCARLDVDSAANIGPISNCVPSKGEDINSGSLLASLVRYQRLQRCQCCHLKCIAREAFHPSPAVAEPL